MRKLWAVEVFTASNPSGVLLHRAHDAYTGAMMRFLDETKRRRRLRPGQRPLCLLCPAEVSQERKPGAYTFLRAYDDPADNRALGSVICAECLTGLDASSLPEAVARAHDPLFPEGDGVRVLPPFSPGGTA